MSHCQTCHGGCWIDPAKPSTSDNWTRMGKIVQWFDRLSQADFRNGAVRDEIRKYLMDLEAKDAAIAQAVAQEREACALLCEETKDCENDTDYYHTSEGYVRLADAIRARTP